jgi:hypothetical protein
VRPWDLTQSAHLRGPTMEYLEKVRSQFLSLRHSFRPPNFSINEWAENLPIKWGFRELRL